MATGLEGGVEDRWVEPWIARVDDHISTSRACQFDQLGPIGRVDTYAHDMRRADLGRRSRRTILVHVGHDDVLENLAAGSNRRNG